MPPLRVIFCIGAFFPTPTGATYSAIRLARGLRDRGVAVSFIVDERGPDWIQGGDYDGFPVRSFWLHLPGKMRKLRGLLRFTRHLLARRDDFDLLHIQGGGYVNLFLSWWARLITGKPTLMKITLDGWDTPDGMAAEKWGTLSLFFYRRLNAVIGMTSGQAEKCRAWNLPAKIAVIPNGVDCERYRPVTPEEKIRLRDDLKIPRDAFVLCYVGWLGLRKGTDVLLETWRQLREKNKEIFLLAAGNYLPAGWEKPVNETLPQSPFFRAVGHVEDAERYLQASDVFVFPSRQEGFGTVQIEAMACGLPCVVNDLPGVSCDIYPDTSCGFRIASNRVEDFVDKIGRLRADPALRAAMGHAGRKRAQQHFSLPSVVDRYLDIYSQLIEIRSPNR
jgi:glycosyltransferase involved in cell wall biosynthesis